MPGLDPHVVARVAVTDPPQQALAECAGNLRGVARRGHPRLPALLRILGSVAVLLSLYFFLLKGWDGSSDLVRYLLLSGHTVALAVTGLASGHWLREAKSARVLITLSLVSVVANFSVLGSFLYAEFGPPLEADFLASMLWDLESPLAVVMLSVASVFLLLPIVMIGFRVLARGMSRHMIGAFMIGNAALLLPLRDPVLVAVIAFALGSYALTVNWRGRRQRIESRTLEGMVALSLQFVPAITLLVRNMWLHGGQELLTMSAALMGFMALRQLSAWVAARPLLASLADLVSVLLAAVTGVSALAVAGQILPRSDLDLVAATALGTGLLYELSLRATTLNTVLRGGAGLLAAAILVPTTLLGNELAVQVAVMMFGLGAIALSYDGGQRTTLGFGALIALSGTFTVCADLWYLFSPNTWIVCALFGIAAIILASVIESRGSALPRHESHKRLEAG